MLCLFAFASLRFDQTGTVSNIGHKKYDYPRRVQASVIKHSSSSGSYVRGCVQLKDTNYDPTGPDRHRVQEIGCIHRSPASPEDILGSGPPDRQNRCITNPGPPKSQSRSVITLFVFVYCLLHLRSFDLQTVWHFMARIVGRLR